MPVHIPSLLFFCFLNTWYSLKSPHSCSILAEAGDPNLPLCLVPNYSHSINSTGRSESAQAPALSLDLLSSWLTQLPSLFSLGTLISQPYFQVSELQGVMKGILGSDRFKYIRFNCVKCHIKLSKYVV